MSRVLNYITSSMWAMRERDLSAMLAIAVRDTDALERLALEAERRPEAMLAKSGAPLSGTRYVEMRDSVAVIDVNGRLAKRMDMFTEICEGGTSTELLLKDFQTALTNPAVSAIVFNIDSGGGEAFGINELSQHIYNARGKKPLKAYVSGLGCSGAYWIASACDEVITDKSAFLGSIGVVSAWIDDTEAYRMLGFDKKVVVSSNAPKKRLDLNKPEDMTEFVAELDAMEKVFISAVARNRKKKTDEVVADFNQGGVLSGSDAVKVGMADRTGSLETVIKELSNKRKNSNVSAASAEGDLNMSFTEKLNTFLVENGWKKSVEHDAAPEAADDSAKLLAEKQAADERASTANAELAKVKAEQVETAKKQIATDAATYVESEVKAGRLFPAEKESFTSLYVQAATDDLNSPLAEGSRLATIKANQEKRAPHGLTDEVVDTKANQVLFANAGNEGEISASREKELLEKTHLGKAALRVVK